MISGVLDMSPAMIDPIKGLAKLATVKFSSVFGTLLVEEKRAKMTDFVLKSLANGTLEPVIDKTFPPENIVEAYRAVENADCQTQANAFRSLFDEKMKQ